MIVISIDTDNIQNELQSELKKIFDNILGKINRSDVFGIMDSNGNLVGNYRKEQK